MGKNSLINERHISALVALLLLVVIVIGIYQRVLLPWSYLLPAILIGVLTSRIILTGEEKSSIFLILVMGLVLWNVYNLATGFSMIPLYDAYSEYIFAAAIFENGHFQLRMNWPLLYPTPTDPSSYPLFSTLTVTLASITGIDLTHTAMIMTVVNGLTALLFTALFVKFLSNGSPQGSVILPMALLFLVTSPDGIYHAMHFYHRHFSLALGFLMLYLLAKRLCLSNVDVKSTALLVFFISILPLSYSYYPAVYTVSLFWLTVFSYLVNSFKKIKSIIHITPPILVFLISFTSGFLWYFNIIFPNTFTRALEWYINQLKSPTLSSLEIGRSLNTTAVLPRSLTLAPVNGLLYVRDLLMFLPIPVCIILLLYGFVIKRRIDAKKVFLIFITASFAPLAITNFFAGGWGTLEWRYYMMPIIIYFAAAFYSGLLQKGRKGKQLVSILILFFVILSFTSLFSHLYFPRYLYDPSVKLQEIGQPSPAYITLKGFINSYLPENGHIVSDDVFLLHMLLPYKKFEQIGDQRYFGKPNTIFVELTDLRNPRDATLMFNQSELVTKSYKVLDGEPYAVYYTPNN